ncbi:hypothetical protein GGX14DRAFT_399769 [Mycena pura]|uniref:Uncharacterized protein n=1 Tax=Mycena pura TaxID=153505 RepID=A0AAD6V3F1_9AGAR|nr:hypothetical protein GGX14DRAFT_399769 [Mycena pura]
MPLKTSVTRTHQIATRSMEESNQKVLWWEMSQRRQSGARGHGNWKSSCGASEDEYCQNIQWKFSPSARGGVGGIATSSWFLARNSLRLGSNGYAMDIRHRLSRWAAGGTSLNQRQRTSWRPAQVKQSGIWIREAEQIIPLIVRVVTRPLELAETTTVREVRALELLGIRYVYDDSVRVAYVVSETINVPIGMLLMSVMSSAEWLNGIG